MPYRSSRNEFLVQCGWKQRRGVAFVSAYIFCLSGSPRGRHSQAHCHGLSNRRIFTCIYINKYINIVSITLDSLCLNDVCLRALGNLSPVPYHIIYTYLCHIYDMCIYSRCIPPSTASHRQLLGTKCLPAEKQRPPLERQAIASSQQS